MEVLTVGFSTPKQFHCLSYLIQKIEKTQFSHVYIKFYSQEFEEYIIYQASGLKVNFISYDKFKQEHEIFKEFNFFITKDSKPKIYKELVNSLGVDYGIKQLLGLGIIKLLSFINIKIKNPFADKARTYICSEACETILVNYLGFKSEDLDSITPKDIYEQCSKR